MSCWSRIVRFQFQEGSETILEPSPAEVPKPVISQLTSGKLVQCNPSTMVFTDSLLSIIQRPAKKWIPEVDGFGQISENFFVLVPEAFEISDLEAWNHSFNSRSPGRWGLAFGKISKHFSRCRIWTLSRRPDTPDVIFITSIYMYFDNKKVRRQSDF